MMPLLLTPPVVTTPNVTVSLPTLTLAAFNRQRHGDAFYELNQRWINTLFALEPADVAQLRSPETSLLADGGWLWMAERHEGAAYTVVGSLGMKPFKADLPVVHPFANAKVFVLIKLAVDPHCQGMGLAKRLMAQAEAVAREKGADYLYLETSDRLQAATTLYQRLGYTHLSPALRPPTPYARCNVWMTKPLTAEAEQALHKAG
jgi:ribosomal protein S18 acetylase RimI-like enzyme